MLVGARGALALTMVVAVVSSSGWARAGDVQRPTRVIERTLLCSTLPDALGDRLLTVGASPRSATSHLQAGVSAIGDGDHKGLVSANTVTTQGSGLFISASLCRRSRAQIPLSSAGLPGPPTRFATTDKCRASTKVLVRVRAVIANWKGWTRVASSPEMPRKLDVDLARGLPREVSIAVRTNPNRRPVAFVSFDQEKRSKSFIANWPRCGIP